MVPSGITKIAYPCMPMMTTFPRNFETLVTYDTMPIVEQTACRVGEDTRADGFELVTS